MHLNESHISDLMNAIHSNSLTNTSQEDLTHTNEKSIYDFGSIWHGDFYANTELGRFGSDSKRNHYGMIADHRKRLRKKPTRYIAPITSKEKSGSKVLILAPGTLKTSQKKQSFVILKYKLLVRRSVLVDSFEYIQRLSEDYIREARRIIKNG